jgi:hypothetical protein
VTLATRSEDAAPYEKQDRILIKSRFICAVNTDIKLNKPPLLHEKELMSSYNNNNDFHTHMMIAISIRGRELPVTA